MFSLIWIAKIPQTLSLQWEFKLGPERPGGRLNKKDGLTRYGDSHIKDKTS